MDEASAGLAELVAGAPQRSRQRGADGRADEALKVESLAERWGRPSHRVAPRVAETRRRNLPESIGYYRSESCPLCGPGIYPTPSWPLRLAGAWVG